MRNKSKEGFGKIKFIMKVDTLKKQNLFFSFYYSNIIINKNLPYFKSRAYSSLSQFHDFIMIKYN